MKPIEEIREFLENCPELQIEESTDSLKVLSSELTGFDVSFSERENGYVISFGEWYEYLPKSDRGATVAVGLFKFGLSACCRLKIFRKGRLNYKCELEYKGLNSIHWSKVATQSLIIFPFWEKEEIHYLQNNFIGTDFFQDVFKGDDFEQVITEIKYERKNVKYAFIYSSVWSALFLVLNKFDFTKILVSLLLYFPVIVITLILPLVAMRNWFNDRKFGKTKKVVLSANQKHFLFIWISTWFLGFLIVYILWGIENLITIFIMLFPFLLIAFCIPLFIVFQKK